MRQLVEHLGQIARLALTGRPTCGGVARDRQQVLRSIDVEPIADRAFYLLDLAGDIVFGGPPLGRLGFEFGLRGGNRFRVCFASSSPVPSGGV